MKKVADPTTENVICFELSPVAMGLVLLVCQQTKHKTPEALIRHLLAQESASLTDAMTDEKFEEVFRKGGAA